LVQPEGKGTGLEEKAWESRHINHLEKGKRERVLANAAYLSQGGRECKEKEIRQKGGGSVIEGGGTVIATTQKIIAKERRTSKKRGKISFQFFDAKR